MFSINPQCLEFSHLLNSAGQPKSMPRAFRFCSHLEVNIYSVKSLRVLRQLITDVFRSDKNTFQMRPGPLYFKPNGDN